jgi:DNA-damage-inducible protein D
MANEIKKERHPTFESIRRVNQFGQDFWSARELGKVLGYSEYRNFLPVIEKAKEACKKSGHIVPDHFVEYHEMIDIGEVTRPNAESIKKVESRAKKNIKEVQ